MRDLTSILSSAPADAGDSRALRQKLLDMEDHLGQQVPRLIQSTDGHAYIGWSGLQTEQVDVDHFPPPAPQARLLRVGETNAKAPSFDFRNRSTLGRMEQSMNDYGVHDIVDAARPRGARILMRANLAGTSPLHEFQVTWLGSRGEWHMSEGVIHKEENTTPLSIMDYPVKGGTFKGDRGYIVVPLRLIPETQDGEGLKPYSVLVEDATLKEMPLRNPPRRTPVVDTPEEGGFSIQQWNWTEGAMDLIIAQVDPPSRQHRIPHITQYVTGTVTLPRFWNKLWNPSFSL